jgi:DNA-directed RNA polymerase specialized sigma24 family protein
MRRDDIDFHYVPEEHIRIHERLLNWAKWLRPGWVPGVAPGFELYQSPAYAKEDASCGQGVDGGDACRVHSVVQTLPVRQRATLTWCYCRPVNPRSMAKSLDVTMVELSDLLMDARQRLIDQGA